MGARTDGRTADGRGVEGPGGGDTHCSSRADGRHVSTGLVEREEKFIVCFSWLSRLEGNANHFRKRN